MGGSPVLKVYSREGEYLAAFKYAEDAAALVALRGSGATIRRGHRRVVWTEGMESQPAIESYDYVAEVASRR